MIEPQRLVSNTPEQDKALSFSPNRIPDGIETADPMLDFRAKAYPISLKGRQYECTRHTEGMTVSSRPAKRGLTSDEAARRLQLIGPNEPLRPRRPNAVGELLRRFANPLVAILRRVGNPGAQRRLPPPEP